MNVKKTVGLSMSGQARFHWFIVLGIVALVATALLTNHTPATVRAASTPLYTFTTFTNSSQTSLFVYQSHDGLNFTKLAGPTYTPPTGLMRDPSIMRHTDGLYYITYTTTTKGNTIGIASSPDLVHWTFRRMITIPAPIFVTWAPEWFKDTDGSINIILNLNRTNTGDANFIPHKITALNSSLTAWSAPVALRGITPNYIDGFIVKVGGTYNIFAKNETTKFIERATATNLTGPYTFVGTGNWAGWGQFLEGPTLFQLPNGTWRILMDGYNAHLYWFSDSTNLSTWTKRQLLPDGLSGVVRHGTVLREG